MKKRTLFFLPVSLSIVFAIAFFATKRRMDLVQTEYSITELYNNYCADCHRDDKSTFVDRKWLFGSSKDEVFRSIKYGQPEMGMPSFEKGIDDVMIKDLTDYVLNISRQIKVESLKQYTHLEINESIDQRFRVDTVISGLDVPWGMAFLPGGEMLITERKGELLLFSKDRIITSIGGLPPILNKGQGGLMDIELHPNYLENGWIYFSYSALKNHEKGEGTTSVMRARLKGGTLIDKEVLFSALPISNKGHHWGSRLEFDNEGYLYFSVGDRGDRDRNPQFLDNDCGKIHRIHDDGSIPHDNPFVNEPNARQTIYSYGHRNPQGLCMNPETGRIWEDEHGPKGGDEVNLIDKGRNYGWPLVSFGVNYDGTKFTNDTAKVGMEQPITYWIPSIAPCGMTFVKGDKYPGWKNNILTGSLRFQYLQRCVLDGDKIIFQEKLLEGIGRVRNVEIGNDGFIYVAIEKPGKIIRLIPVNG